MFVVDCGRCRKRRLVSVQRVRAMRNLAGGVIAVELACYCGQPAIVLTGRAAGRATACVAGHAAAWAAGPAAAISAPGARPSEASP